MRAASPAVPTDAFARLQDWYHQPLGRMLADCEQEALTAILPDLFGYHLLLLDPPWHDHALGTSRITHRFVMQGDLSGDSQSVGVLGSAEALPIATDSLDAMILPHTLELARDPHQVLREADRCLIPEGHVVILGFNPRGLWGLWRLLAGRRHAPWHNRFISLPRVVDWLSLLGFDTVQMRPLFFRPPLGNRAAMERLGFLDALGRRPWYFAAGAWLLVARKRVATLTPIRPRWRPRRLLATGLAEPSNRVKSNFEC